MVTDLSHNHVLEHKYGHYSLILKPIYGHDHVVSDGLKSFFTLIWSVILMIMFLNMDLVSVIKVKIQSLLRNIETQSFEAFAKKR